MPSLRASRPGYDRAERVSDAAVHVTGLSAALMAVPVLVTITAVLHRDATVITAIVVYGVTVIAMILCSALYHMVPAPDWKGFLKRVDHCAIYVKIAGTYTPFTLLSGGHGLALLTGLWTAAIAGSGFAIFGPERSTRIGVIICLAMGWAVLFGGWQLLGTMSVPVVALIASGGILYSVGTVFLMAEQMRFHNTIWHVFVLTATIVFFVAVTMHVAQTSGPDHLAGEAVAGIG